MATTQCYVHNETQALVIKDLYSPLLLHGLPASTYGHFSVEGHAPPNGEHRSAIKTTRSDTCMVVPVQNHVCIILHSGLIKAHVHEKSTLDT